MTDEEAPAVRFANPAPPLRQVGTLRCPDCGTPLAKVQRVGTRLDIRTTRAAIRAGTDRRGLAGIPDQPIHAPALVCPCGTTSTWLADAIHAAARGRGTWAPAQSSPH